jgi:hypothetical protein
MASRQYSCRLSFTQVLTLRLLDTVCDFDSLSSVRLGLRGFEMRVA